MTVYKKRGFNHNSLQITCTFSFEVHSVAKLSFKKCFISSTKFFFLFSFLNKKWVFNKNFHSMYNLELDPLYST